MIYKVSTLGNITGDMKTKSKTFQQGDDFNELYEWLMKQFEVNDWQPEGTLWCGGEPSPYDPVCELKHKYVVTIRKVELQEIH